MLYQVKNGDAVYWIEASNADEALASMIETYDPFTSFTLSARYHNKVKRTA
jgi:hypothetical protein